MSIYIQEYLNDFLWFTLPRESRAYDDDAELRLTGKKEP
jgi:hypothetical protein